MIGKMNRKGWNVYALNKDTYSSVSLGPVNHMEPGKSYFLCPSVFNPRDVNEVNRATRHIVVCCGRLPSIKYRKMELQIPYFSFDDESISINLLKEPISHDEFLRALDTMQPTVDLN